MAMDVLGVLCFGVRQSELKFHARFAGLSMAHCYGQLPNGLLHPRALSAFKYEHEYMSSGVWRSASL